MGEITGNLIARTGRLFARTGKLLRRTGKEFGGGGDAAQLACEVVSAPVIRTSDDAHGPRGDRAKAPARAEAAGDDRGRRLGRAARSVLKSFLASPAAWRLAAVQHFGDRGGDRRPNEGGESVLSRARARPVSWATISWTSSAVVARTLALHRFPQDALTAPSFAALGAAGGTASTSTLAAWKRFVEQIYCRTRATFRARGALDLDEL